MVVIFAICWLPLNIVHMVAEFHRFETSHYRVLFLTTHVIAMSSTVYNPFLYSWLNDNFRKEFQQIVPCLFQICWCLNRRSRDTPSTQLTNLADADLNDRPSSYQMPAESTIAMYTQPCPQMKNSNSNGKLNGVAMKKFNNSEISHSSPVTEMAPQQHDPLLLSPNHL